MKRLLFFLIPICLFLFNSCSVQEKISIDILRERLETECTDLIFENEGFYEGNDYYVFALYKNISTSFKFKFDDSGTVYKVSASFSIDKNSNVISEMIKPIISVFSPREDSDNIVKNLINGKKEYNYFYGKEYTYSLVVNEKNTYFEIFNNALSDYSIPELTLKENDKNEF